MLVARLVDHEVLFIVAPANLRSGNGNDILPPVARQFRALHGAEPVALALSAALCGNQAHGGALDLAASILDRRRDGMLAVSLRRKAEGCRPALAERDLILFSPNAEADMIRGHTTRHSQLHLDLILPGKGKGAIRLN